MSTPIPFTRRFDASFEQVVARPQPAWLSTRRRQSYARFQQQGLPTTRAEEWKYTSLAALDQAPPTVQTPARSNASPFDAEQVLRIACADGHVLLDGELPPGLTLMPLAQALAESRLAAMTYFGSLTEADAFADFNTALWTEGLYLELAPGVTLAQPLYLQQNASGPLRHLLVLGQDSQATLIQHSLPGTDAASFANCVNECILDTTAQLTHVELQEAAPQARLIARNSVRQNANSQYTHLALSSGGLLIRNDLSLQLDGPGARCTLHGLSLGHGRSHIDQHVFVDHARGGVSRQLYKSVLWDRARAVFNGRVRVAPGAVKSDAQQLARNLLLSRDAEADSRPQLEIFADDVKCSHGAATGSLDEAQVFYLRARGLSPAAARQLLVQGFAVQVLEMLDTGLRTPLAAWLHDQLEEARHAA